MKKWLIALGSLVGALLLAALVTGTVFAQGPVGSGEFLDEDGDGLCDVCGGLPGEGYGLLNENGQFVDEDGDGFCDICGEALGESHTHEWGYARGNGYGLVDENGEVVQNRFGSNGEFVDEDGDGLCDVCGGLPGEGYGQFVDEDGDGLCDTYGEGAAAGNGPQFRTEGETEQTPMARRGGFARRAAAQ